MVHVLRVNRATFTLLMAAVSAAAAYLSFVINSYEGPVLAGPTVVFITALSSAFVAYLGTVEQATNGQNPLPTVQS